MSLLAALFGRSEKKAVDASALTFAQLLGNGGRSKTGLSVTEITALRVSTVYACCRVLCEDVGKLPLKLMVESAGGKKKVAREHPLHKILNRRPNQWQTSMEFRMTLLLHALLGKGGYAFVNRSTKGEVLELIPMLPSSVCVRQDAEWNVSYEWSNGSGKKILLPRENVHALHGLSWNGLTALEVIQQGKEAIGLAMASEETQARLHGQGARPGGIVTTTAKLSDAEVTNIKATFASGYTGVDNAFKTLLLDNGLDFKPWATNGVDGQHLQQRALQIEEICRFFRVFPQSIGAGDKTSTYASAEAFFGAHVVHSLSPWISLWEQALERDLLTEKEQIDGYFVKFSIDGLLRGSSAARAEFYKAGINDGWLSRNEVRGLEDLNPVAGLDEMLRPLNMGPGGAPGNGPAAKKPAVPDANPGNPGAAAAAAE